MGAPAGLWPLDVYRQMLDALAGVRSAADLRTAACRPKGVWTSSRQRRGVKTHMVSSAIMAWNRGGNVRLGVMTRCGTFMDNAFTDLQPIPGTLCDHCLLAEPAGGHAVYMFLNADGEVIYVGFSSNPSGRMDAHRTQSKWWPEVASARLTPYPDELSARRAERQAIEDLRPKHNIDGNPDRRPARRRKFAA